MTWSIVVALTALGIIGWLAAWMLAQKQVTSVQKLIQQHRYEDAVAEAERQTDHLHRAEALKLLGRFDEAITAYERSDDPAAIEGIALSLAHRGRDLERARRMMEEMIARYPQIQEFQALGLAFIQLRGGDREAALRLYRDNVELLETRFKDDYTDPDPLLAETLILYAELAAATGDETRADALRRQAAAWAPASVWAKT